MRIPDPILSQADAVALLARLEAEFGDMVVVSLVGAAMVADATALHADPEAADSEFVPEDWLADFAIPVWARDAVTNLGF